MTTKRKPTTAPAPAPVSKARRLNSTMEGDKTQDRHLAEVAAGGLLSNAFTLAAFRSPTFGELAVNHCVGALKDTAKAVHGGDLRMAETMLTAQAVALDAIFNELARRSGANMGEYMDASERYMRLALKAQGQCRATLETLATIKNPPVVFARQANINHGGQQQVNNGQAPAHATNATTAPTELLNQQLEQQHGEWLDPAAAGTAGGADPRLATVGEINRPAQC